MPKVREELNRESRWTRAFTLASVLLAFVLAMLSLCAWQVSMADFISLKSLQDYVASKESRLKDVQRADLEGLDDQQVSVSGVQFSIEFNPVKIFTYGAWGALFIFTAASAFVHTRRYRYSWKHWWAPALSMTFYCLATFIFVHFLNLVTSSGRQSSTPDHVVRIAGQDEALIEALSAWQQEYGYRDTAKEEWDINQDDANVGKVYGRNLLPKSWFDAYQASWRFKFLRPRPPLRLTLITTKDPQQALCRIKLPYHFPDSPELQQWDELLASLDASLSRAADADAARE